MGKILIHSLVCHWNFTEHRIPLWRKEIMMERHSRIRYLFIIFPMLMLSLSSCVENETEPPDYGDYAVYEVPLTEVMNADASRFHSRREQADYVLDVSKALDDRFIDLTSDSLIAPAVRFYRHHGPKRKQMLTSFYNGRVLLNMGKVPESRQAFERAERLARQLKDDFYLGLIYRNFSMLCEELGDTEMTVAYIRCAASSFQRAGSEDYERYERMALATALGNNGEHQSSCALFDSLLNKGGLNPNQLQELHPAYERELLMAGGEHVDPQDMILRINTRRAFSRMVQENTDSIVLAAPSVALKEKESRIRQFWTIALICVGVLLAGLVLAIVRKRRELSEAMARVEAVQQSLSLATEKNALLANSIIKDQIDALQLLSEEYDQSTRPAMREHYFQVFKKRLDEFRNQGADLTLLEASVNEYRDGAMALLREEIPGQSTLFYRNAAMFFAGLPYDLMSLLTRSSIPALKSWKTILRKKLTSSEAPHKELFLNLLDSAVRRPGGRPRKTT